MQRAAGADIDVITAGVSNVGSMYDSLQTRSFHGRHRELYLRNRSVLPVALRSTRTRHDSRTMHAPVADKQQRRSAV